MNDSTGAAQVWQVVADSKGQFGIPTKVGDCQTYSGFRELG
ncbi:MAG TPA: hypothetical protein VGM44_08520 [Polyangiaceae bacterium]